MCQRTSHRTISLFCRKLLSFQRTFHEKFLVSGFGADSPNIQYTRKNAVCTAFFNYRNMLELRSKLCFKELFVKSSLKIRKNFAQTHHFIFAKLLSFQRTFHEKPFGQGLGRIAPTDNAHAKKHGNAVLFCFPLPYFERRAMEKSIQTKFCIVTHTEKELCDIIRSCILFLSI